MRALISFLVLLSASLANATTTAWFVTALLTPTDSTLVGVPLEQVDRTLKLVKVPTLADLPQSADSGVEELKRGEYAFDVSVDLNGDGVVERALVGVYLAKNGETGRFFSILGPGSGLSTKVLLFERIPPDSRFSFLSWNKKVLSWYGCLNCGYGATVEWKNGRFSLKYW